MIDIRMPDGGVVRLPDGMTERHIRQLLTRMRPSGAGATAAASPSPAPRPSRFAVVDAAGGDGSERSASAKRGALAELADRLAAFGSALENAMPPPVHHGGGIPGNRRQNGNALADVLNNPTMADMLLKRRLGFLG